MRSDRSSLYQESFVAGPVRELEMAGPDESSATCPKCMGRLLKYVDDPYFQYCPECRLNVMVVDGEALEEVA